MLTLGVTVHDILSNAYGLFCFVLGVWALIIAVRGGTIGGGFWGALAIETGLAVTITLITLLLQLGGVPPSRGWVYYLYLIYFVIVLPGTYALLRGRDDRTAAWVYAAVILFTAAATTTRTDLLTGYAAQLAQLGN